MSKYTSYALDCLLLFALAGPASSAEWGSIKGKFVVEGSVGTPAAIAVTKDQETCSKHDLVDETVVVGEDNALANVVVYIYTARGKKLEVHPDYGDAKSAEPAVLDNKGCRFEPHVLEVRTGQTLQVSNSDPIGHNTNAALVMNPTFNPVISSDSPFTVTLTKPEPIPAPVSCNIHPWMKAHIVVRDDPYVAISNDKGEFEIKNIPVGQHDFVFWQEAKGFLRNLTLKAGKTDRRGRAKLKIAAGETLDLGEIKVPASALGK